MKKIYLFIDRKSWRVTLIMIILFIQPPLLPAQNPDNPNLDQVPACLREMLNRSRPGTPVQSSVITIDNWDNYALGIDFGESTVATNPANPPWFFTAYNINETHHTENGLDWDKNNPGWTNMAGDPVVVCDSLGNLYYINLSGSPVAGAKVVRSTDNGQSWQTPVAAATGSDKCWIACDQTNGPYADYVYICMTNVSTGYFARSTDHGVTFENTFNFTTQSLPGMSICVGPYNNIQGGSVYVVTNSGDPFASVYTFYRSVNGGATFTQMSSEQFAGYVGTSINGRHSVEGMRTRPYPYIAADNSFGPHRGRLYCVYSSNDPPGDGNRPDIWCRYSTNGGTTWSDPKRVNDDPNPQSNHQWHPAIWCDKQTGRFYIQWMDTRDTPSHDSAYIYGTWSDDGGITFRPNQRISNKKMKIDCPTCGGSGSPRYQGDYNGIVSNRKVAMAGWTDFRNGTFLSLTSYLPDFSMALDKTADSLNAPTDSTDVLVSIPGVRLYSDTVLLTGTVSPAPAGGSLTVLFPAGNRIVSFPSSKIARIKVSGIVPLGYYTVTIFAKGPNGTPVHVRNLSLKVKSTGYIYVMANALPPAICPGSTSQLLATAQGGSGAYSYAWLPLTGLNNPSIQNPVASPTVTTLYHVQVTDTAGHSASDSVLVTIMGTPSTPGTIAGPDSVCRSSTVTLSVTAVPGVTSYSWIVPPGASITAGQNTPEIEVIWGSTSGNVSVIAGNPCGNSNPSVKQITAITQPGIPVQIFGPDTACQGSAVQYAVGTVAEANLYTWGVPSGTTINSGQGTTAITATFGQYAGAVSVIASNDCGSSDPQLKEVSVGMLPDPAGAISGNDTVCVNHVGFTYSVPAVGGAVSYLWELPHGAYITSGDSSNAVTVNFDPSAVSGILSVRGVNPCGSGIVSSKTIVVKECLGNPELAEESGIRVYPNPTAGMLNVSVTGISRNLHLTLISIDGREILSRNNFSIGADLHFRVDVSGFPKGLYFLKILHDDHVFFTKVVLQ